MGRPLVMTGISFAACPAETEAPRQLPARSSNVQRRPNAIKLSPARFSNSDHRVEIRKLALDPLFPLPRSVRRANCRGLPEFLSWPGLLLERTVARQPRRARSPLTTLGEISGTQGN